MDQWQQALGLYRKNRALRTVKALTKNNFNAIFVSDRQDALQKLLQLIPSGAKVGIGDSLTLRQIDIIPALEQRGNSLINPFAGAEEDFSLARESFLADFFITGANAVTMDGKILAVDSIGNRAAPMIYGPKRVIIAAGVNKITSNLEAARERVKNYAAPVNATRLQKNTPCTTTGCCSDCFRSDRICNVEVVLHKKPRCTDMDVIIVGEELGL